ncbi:MAG: FHA domain-containing protein [Gammaproteobacteria bacterium]|nr:FHA domain-containing protein [Gammaproteobacteria bacterium]
MLKIQFKDGRSDPIVLSAPGKTIGKGSANDIVLDEEGVNAFHADLKVDGETVTLTDVGTQTGTSLNGTKLTGPVMLRAGDLISIQGVELEVVGAESAAPEGKTLVLSGTARFEMGLGSWAIVADSGPEKGQVIAIKEKTSIGRALECDISILEPGLSRQHAELEILDAELIIRDLGSSNGTYLNGKKISQAVCRGGDVLQFERIKFIVRAP